MKIVIIALVLVLFYSQSDAQSTDVYINVSSGVQYQLIGTWSIHTVSKADHRATFVYAVLHQEDWFDRFLKK
ncbi:MAG: hypothetical protein NTU51_04300 [Bacteroidetes bacterium]|nr:hypothetical protein [Bacteroidota bacterium]